MVGPGLLSEPGLGLAGVAGTLTAPGVWKYNTVVKPEQPALLHASTFQRYGLPALRLAGYEVLLGFVATPSALDNIFLWPTPKMTAPTEKLPITVQLLRPAVGPGMTVR